MNILFLNVESANPIRGGIQCVSYYLYKYFKSRGHKVTMLAWYRVVDNDAEDFVYMPDPSEILSESNKLFLTNLLQEYGIDVVLNHTCLSLQYSPVLKFIHNRGTKIVSVFHSSPFGVYGYNKYKWLRELKNISLRNFFDLMIRYAFLLKYRKQFRMQATFSDRMVTLSDKFIPEYLFFAGKQFQNKMTAIPNPVTADDLTRTVKENILLFVGRLSSEKGLPHLLNIWAKLESDFPDWKLQILGDGAEKAFVESSIKELNLKRCEVLGFQKPEPYYNKAKIFCMTSLYEGFGLVLVEAMKYGTVPFAFKSYPNVVDIVNDGKDGVLVTPFDVEEYASKLRELMTNPDKLQVLSKQAEVKSREFSIEKIGLRWEVLFKKTITEV